MAGIINEAARRGGPILIPAFAVGRTQEVLYMLRELEEQNRIPVLPVIVDSPMAAQATQVYNRWHEEHDREYASILAHKRHPLRTASMSTTSTREESKKLNNLHGARIIISASGMLTGYVLHHAMRILPDENATVVFVGYQAAGTTGRRIQDGEREVRIMKNWVKVNCHIEKRSKASQLMQIGKPLLNGSAACRIGQNLSSRLTESLSRPRLWLSIFEMSLPGMSSCPSTKKWSNLHSSPIKRIR